MYNDAELNLEFLKKQKQFYKNKNFAGSVKPVLQLRQRAQNFQRSEWRKRQIKCREKKAKHYFNGMQYTSTITPS